jgi:hypothetical protein
MGTMPMTNQPPGTGLLEVPDALPLLSMELSNGDACVVKACAEARTCGIVVRSGLVVAGSNGGAIGFIDDARPPVDPMMGAGPVV